MRFTAVVVSHADIDLAAKTVSQLRAQTRPPDEILIFCSDVGHDQLQSLVGTADRVFSQANKNDWGHAKRDGGIRHAAGEWIGFFNHDDRYDPTYIEKMLKAGKDADVVFCSWNEMVDCVFRGCSSTAGNFIIRTGIARTVGWKGRDYTADADFINAVSDLPGIRIARVDELLYWHNETE